MTLNFKKLPIKNNYFRVKKETNWPSSISQSYDDILFFSRSDWNSRKLSFFYFSSDPGQPQRSMQHSWPERPVFSPVPKRAWEETVVCLLCTDKLQEQDLNFLKFTHCKGWLLYAVRKRAGRVQTNCGRSKTEQRILPQGLRKSSRNKLESQMWKEEILGFCYLLGFPSGSVVKNPPTMWEPKETWVWSLGWEDPLEEGMATPVILPLRIPRTEEPGGLQSLGSQRVGHD